VQEAPAALAIVCVAGETMRRRRTVTCGSRHEGGVSWVVSERGLGCGAAKKGEAATVTVPAATKLWVSDSRAPRRPCRHWEGA
jgi:hypothetical protein